MYRISFVILHYISYETTCDCIDSICTLPQAPQKMIYKIIVVDNASSNDSCIKLKKKYGSNEQITFLYAPANLGFAKGNNLGYRYAIEQQQADFVIIANNDTEIHQSDFLSKMIQLYELNSYGILGPDILNVNGFHQSPYRDHVISDSELKRWIRNRSLWLAFLRLNQTLRTYKHTAFIQKYYIRRANAGTCGTSSWSISQWNVVLQGSCIIFSPLYIAASPDYAFYPDTFMYCEEDILAYLCQQKEIPTLYSPELQILHKESVSTRLSAKTDFEKDLFLTVNILKSLKIFRSLRTRNS